jgi:hypothetical protein
MDRSAVVGKTLEQRPPLAKPFVEDGGGRRAILRHVEFDVRPPGDVLEPVSPQRPRVCQHGIEIEGNRLQALDARLALLTGER